MKFLCLGYIDEDEWNALSEEERQERMRTCMEYDDVLRQGGHFGGGACLESAKLAVTIKHRDGKVIRTDGPFAETKEVLGGVLSLEARDLEHAIDLMEKHPGVQMGPFEIRSQMQVGQSAEDELRALIEKWSRALERKDVETMMEDYLPEAILFDAVPPYKVEGRENIKKAWQACLPYFPDNFRSEHRDLVVQVEGNLAFVFGLHHFVTEPADHPCGQTWMRVSIGYRKLAGSWKVAHEHISIPFNPLNNQAWQIPDPEALEIPNYDSAEPCGAAKES